MKLTIGPLEVLALRQWLDGLEEGERMNEHEPIYYLRPPTAHGWQCTCGANSREEWPTEDGATRAFNAHLRVAARQAVKDSLRGMNT